MTSYIRCTECGGHATGGLLVGGTGDEVAIGAMRLMPNGGRYRLSPCGHTAAVEIVEDDE